MIVLDVDLDYFMDCVATGIPDHTQERLSESDYAACVWNSERVRHFLEHNLGLSKDQRVLGRIVSGHNEALLFWKELINQGKLLPPFDVVHVDSHADLGLGYDSDEYILNELLKYPVEERPLHNQYIRPNGTSSEEGIGDYLLWSIAYRWIRKITYCGNAAVRNFRKADDYLWYTLKDFHENHIGDTPVENTIQLAYNVNHLPLPYYDSPIEEKESYLHTCIKEPEVPLVIIPTTEAVSFSGKFDYAVFAQSPNYTPASADFILDIFKEYIIEV